MGIGTIISSVLNLLGPLEIGEKISEALDHLSPKWATWLLALAIVSYMLVGWAWALFAAHLPSPLFGKVYLLITPLLLLAAVEFQNTDTWSRIAGLVWLPFYLVIRLIEVVVGGIIELFRKHGDTMTNGVQRLWKWWASRRKKAKAKPTLAQPKPSEEKKLSPDAQQLEEEGGLQEFKEAIRAISPKWSSQFAAAIAWLTWISLWVAPAFIDLSSGWAVARLLVGLLFPLMVLGILGAIEAAYDPFPFWRTTIGMFWTPIYAWLRGAFWVFFLRPEWLQALLRNVWFLRKLYYPAALFLLFNRRYLTYLLATVLAGVICGVTHQGYYLVLGLCLMLYFIEAVRLIGQLREVRYLGVADFDDLTGVLASQADQARGSDKIEEGQRLANALQRYMYVRLSRKVLDETEGDDSYFATVISILLKHIVMIGVAVAALRIFYEFGFRQNKDLSIVDTVINSLILLFGEVTFDRSDLFLNLVNLLGVAASFLLLGLGLTYLSGKAHNDYSEKARILRGEVEKFAQGEEIEAVRNGLLQERITQLSDIGIFDLFVILTKWSRRAQNG